MKVSWTRKLAGTGAVSVGLALAGVGVAAAPGLATVKETRPAAAGSMATASLLAPDA